MSKGVRGRVNKNSPRFRALAMKQATRGTMGHSRHDKQEVRITTPQGLKITIHPKKETTGED